MDGLGLSGTARFKLIAGAAALLLMAVAAWWLIEPAPPRHLVFAAGPKTGAYYAFAERYREIFRREGIDLEVRETAGSVENLRLLTEEGGVVAAGLLQGGLKPEGIEGLSAVANVAYEPIWVFTRRDAVPARLADLAGRRIAIGPEGSGTRPLARALLALTIGERYEALPLAGREAADAVRAGRADALVMVASAQAPIVQELLRDTALGVFAGAQAEAVARRLGHLGVVTLPRGVVDLPADVPPRDLRLVAATAAIVARDSLHPALVNLLLQAADEVHGRSGWVYEPGFFPNLREPEYPANEEAQRTIRRGTPPLLYRYLPFWVAVGMERAGLFLMSAAAVLLALFKLAPLQESYERGKLWRRYKRALAIDRQGRDADAARRQSLLEQLDALDHEVAQLKMGSKYAPEVYDLRVHIDFVRSRLLRKARETGTG